MQKGSYARRSSVYTHRRHEMLRPAKLAADILRVPYPEPVPIAVETYDDVVLPPKRPTPSISKRTDIRLADTGHYTPL